MAACDVADRSEPAGLPTRRSFASLDELPEIPRPVRPASGPQEPALVCLTSVAGPSDPVQYSRRAKPFQGERDVWVMRQPGFRLLPGMEEQLR